MNLEYENLVFNESRGLESMFERPLHYIKDSKENLLKYEVHYHSI